MFGNFTWLKPPQTMRFWHGLFWTWPAFMPGNIGTRKQTRPISEAWRSLVSREIRMGKAIALERMAGLQAEQGRYQQALHMLGEAQALREHLGEIEDVARIQYLRARIYLRLNDLEKARSEIEKTIAIIESQRLRIAKFDSRAQYFASVHEYYSLYIQVLMALDKTPSRPKVRTTCF